MTQYTGQRDYKTLSAFAKGALSGSPCAPRTLDLCDEARQAQFRKFLNMSDEELAIAVAAEEDRTKAVEASFAEELKKLEDEQDLVRRRRDSQVAAVAAGGLGDMQAVQAYQAQKKWEAKSHEEKMAEKRKEYQRRRAQPGFRPDPEELDGLDKIRAIVYNFYTDITTDLWHVLSARKLASSVVAFWSMIFGIFLSRSCCPRREVVDRWKKEE